VVKTDDAGRQTFLDLAGQLEAIQEDQLRQECSTSVVRGAAAVCRFAQIGLKRSKQIAQGGNSFSVKDFIKNLQNKYPAQAQEEAGEGSGIDWKKNSQVRPCGELIRGFLLRWVPLVPGSGAAQQAGRARVGPLLHTFPVYASALCTRWLRSTSRQRRLRSFWQTRSGRALNQSPARRSRAAKGVRM
jgi:hypothetical protein